VRARGSASAELVVCTPVLLLVALVALSIGRLVLDQSQVADVARSAAEAAAVWSDPSSARLAAEETAAYELLGDDLQCNPAHITVDTAQLVPGGEVTVTVSCVVSLAAAIPGLPGNVTLEAAVQAPVEQYRQVG
jgi:Flp pilus assembly protein TadG